MFLFSTTAINYLYQMLYYQLFSQIFTKQHINAYEKYSLGQQTKLQLSAYAVSIKLNIHFKPISHSIWGITITRPIHFPNQV